MKKRHIYIIAVFSTLTMSLLFIGQYILFKNNYEAHKESYRRQLFTAFGVAINKVFINHFDSLNTTLLQLSKEVAIDTGVTRVDARIKNYYSSEWGPKMGFPYYVNSDTGRGWLKEGIPVLLQQFSKGRKQELKSKFSAKISTFANEKHLSLSYVFDSLLKQYNITDPIQYNCFIEYLIFKKDNKEYVLISPGEAPVTISSTWKDKGLSPLKSSGIWKVAGANYEMYCNEVFYWPDEAAFFLQQNSKIILLSSFVVLIFIVLTICTIRYMFKQKKLEDIKNDFINNIKHEMKTPIASLQIASTSLQMKEVIDKPEEVAYLSAIVNRQAKRLQFIWEEISYLAEEKEIPVVKEKINLREQVLSAIESTKLLYPHIKVQTQVERDKEYFIHANKEEMNTVWLNIIDNAFKYALHTDLVLKVLIQESQNNIVVTCSDNGRGVAKADLPYVFDKFYRGEHENIHNTKGLGIGLYTSKKILKQCNAAIEMQNNNNGGVSVSITFKKSRNEYTNR